MLEWPLDPVERTPPDAFRPAHCPWPACSQHHLDSPRAFRYRCVGTYRRKCDGRRVPRFFCHACRRTFSLQSFACTYYLKRPELLPPIAAGLNAGSAHRQLSRTLGCAPSTVTRQSARLGRHALLLQALALQHLPAIREPVAFDHFETFAYSQYDPVGVATPVGRRSWFVYLLDPAPHRRSGRLSPAQRRALAGRQHLSPPAGQVRRSCTRVLDVLAGKAPPDRPLRLCSDGHPAYARALERHPARARFKHRAFPNPPRGPKGSPRSKAAIARDRALFAVDLLHLLLRHSCANHRRETIAFARRTNALLERAYLMVAWRNFVKGRSERRPDRRTPAMVLGLTDNPWSWERVLARRLFPRRVAVPPSWMKIYRREWVTPAMGHNARHALKRAF